MECCEYRAKRMEDGLLGFVMYVRAVEEAFVASFMRWISDEATSGRQREMTELGQKSMARGRCTDCRIGAKDDQRKRPSVS